MSESRTQSRPYAEAAFEVALKDDSLDAWLEGFELIKSALEEEKLMQLIDTPQLSQTEKTEEFCKLFKDEVSDKFQNFLYQTCYNF